MPREIVAILLDNLPCFVGELEDEQLIASFVGNVVGAAVQARDFSRCADYMRKLKAALVASNSTTSAGDSAGFLVDAVVNVYSQFGHGEDFFAAFKDILPALPHAALDEILGWSEEKGFVRVSSRCMPS